MIKKACEKCDSFINGFKQVIAESKTKKDKAELSGQIKNCFYISTKNKFILLNDHHIHYFYIDTILWFNRIISD